ncbi:expressed protein, partial [Phakopsora pachyrhizi]
MGPFIGRNMRQKFISEWVNYIELQLDYLQNGSEVDQRRANAELQHLRKKVLPDLFKIIEAQVYIMPGDIDGTRIKDVILTLQKIILDEYKPDPEFIKKASKTFQSYAQYILKDVNLEFENHRISLLMDLMRIFCPIFGHVGTEKMTESKETLIILAKGIQPIIKGLFDRGEIQNIWKLESYKKIFAYGQAHPLTLIFRNLDRVGNENKWDRLLQEYI